MDGWGTKRPKSWVIEIEDLSLVDALLQGIGIATGQHREALRMVDNISTPL